MYSIGKIQQDLKQKNYTDDKVLHDALESAQIKLIEVLRSNLKTILGKRFETASQEKINGILSILEKSVKNLPALSDDNITEFRERLKSLVTLYDSMQPRMLSKIAKIGLFYNPREKIKAVLNRTGVNFRTTIDPHINHYLETQRDVIANYIAVYNAFEQINRITKIQKEYTNAQLELLVLKRHEVCSDLHKGLGFNPDTGLDALHFPNKQSVFALTAVKSVQNQQLLIMRKLGFIDRVEMIVSPVTRAYETALHATFSPAVVDCITVDNHFSEKQMNTTLISSGRAYRYASDVVNDFIKAGYTNVCAKENFFIEGENKTAFHQRLDKAYQRMLFIESNSEEQNKVTMKVIVGHGRMNNKLMAHLKKKIQNNNIPDTLRKLDFGAQYNLILVKDKEQDIIALDDGGKMDRYGMIEEAPLASLGMARQQLK